MGDSVQCRASLWPSASEKPEFFLLHFLFLISLLLYRKKTFRFKPSHHEETVYRLRGYHQHF
jgi:hypothetical protein